jgi:2-hydroxychromene-2-carboxylate isomerase
MRSIEFLYDFASPNCYVVFYKLREVCERKGTTLKCTPLLLGGLFKITNDAPIPKEAPEYNYMMRNLARLSKGLGIGFNPPHDRFPINSLRAMRGSYFLEEKGKLDEYMSKVFEACWSLNIDISDPQNLKPCVESLGFDFNDFLSFIEKEETKLTLRNDTEKAYRRGVFGAPTFFIDDKEMYWGTPEVLWYIDEHN